jgi:hypothetical protein
MNSSENSPLSSRISRRDVIKWFAAAAAVSQLGPTALLGQEQGALPAGYGSDPKVAGIYNPGDFWPLTLTSDQHRLVTFLADLILPADEFGPAASALRVPDFIDEWVSAPYPKQRQSRKEILSGLTLMNELSRERYGRECADLSEAQGIAIIEGAEQQKDRDSRQKKAADFIYDFTALCMGAYYGTPAGWKAIGYVGNMPLPSFDGPPQEVLDRVGVTQTVK